VIIADQPPPVANDEPAVWPVVIRDIESRCHGGASTEGLEQLADDARERDRVGRDRYGVPLQLHNGRDALVDAYQECLDAMVYLRQACAEELDRAREVQLAVLYSESLELARRVRVILTARGSK
jgi:hypothetical protein